MTWLLDTLVWTGVLIALVLAVRQPVARHFGAKIAYALWALPLMRLIMPPLVLEAPTPSALPAAQSVEATPELIAALAAMEAASAPSAQAPAAWWESLTPLLVAVWLLGAATYIALRLLAYRQLRRDLLDGAYTVGSAGNIRLVETYATRSPLAFGLFDKVIAMPVGFMALPDRAARDLALAHELAHHRAHDLFANFAALPLFAIHWFNPLSRLGWNAMRRDQEAACDARVVHGRDRVERAHYAALIAGAAAAPRAALAAPMACPVLGEKSIIHRLRNLTMTDHSIRRRRMGGTLIGFAALALPLTASITYAQSEAPEAPLPPEAPVPSAAPDAPEAPTPPLPPESPISVQRIVIESGDEGEAKDGVKKERRVVIIRDGKAEHLGAKGAGEHDAMRFHFRGIDGKEFNPDDPKFAEAMKRLEERMANLDKEIAGTIVIDSKKMAELGERSRKMAELSARMAPRVEMSCDDKGGSSEAKTEDGRRVFRFCQKSVLMGAAGGLRAARATIAGNSAMSEEVRKEVLEDLDREIERLERENKG
ncbi:M56 family metallopeptidase [Tsuneonella troitsensis]|uniref:M56 family metallopeptidase n=1 Tax=Tsuneonella troitsensis TaxID=292222 RepID=UPI00070EA0AC|nr:M56 family metallopeptidase [Tsuneonella troitsensis]